MGHELPTAASAGGNFDSGSTERRLAEPHSRGWAALLATILVSFAIQGIAHPAAWEQLLVTCLLGATVVIALEVVGARPVVRKAALVTVAATVFVSFIEAANGAVDGRATRLANGLLVALAPPAIVVGVVRSLRAKRSVTLDAVLGVICIYVLIGMLFAFLYGAIDHVGGMPFFAQNEAATVSRCLYFSFTTLCTVGYGDLTARTDLGHTLAVSEALVGQIYLVTIVSLIVSNLGRRREPAASGAP